MYSDVWNWSNFYSTTTRLFLCFAITEAILYKVELVWTHHSTCRALYWFRRSRRNHTQTRVQNEFRTRSKKLSKITPQMAEQKEESGQIKKLIYWLTFWKNILVSGMSIVQNTTSEMLGSELTRKWKGSSTLSQPISRKRSMCNDGSWNSAMFYVISMETRVELRVILTHNSLFRHTCRVAV